MFYLLDSRAKAAVSNTIERVHAASGGPVATRTSPDDGVPKTLRFWPARARYVRFRALTEAGGRGPWTSAAEVAPLGWA